MLQGCSCISGVGTYLPGTVLHAVIQAVFKSSIGTYLPGTVLQGCRLFKECWSLPAGHCVAGGADISAMSDLPAGYCVAVVQGV